MSHLSYHPLIYTLWKIFCPPYKSAAACFKAVFFKGTFMNADCLCSTENSRSPSGEFNEDLHSTEE